MMAACCKFCTTFGVKGMDNIWLRSQNDEQEINSSKGFKLK